MAEEIKLKLGVSPLIMDPTAMNPSNLLIFLAITTGISNAPGTSNVLKKNFLFFTLCNKNILNFKQFKFKSL